MSLGWW